METFNLRFQSPCCIQIAGYSQTGKSFLTAQIIRERERLFTQQFEHIVWVYSEWQNLYQDLRDDVKNIIFTKSLEEAEEYTKDEKSTLLVLDDCLMELLTSSNKILPLFIMKSHHGNNTIIMLTQAIFVQKSRLMQVNCQYLITLKLARDSSSILRLAYQLYPLNPKFVYKAYLESVNRKPYAHFLIDSYSTQADIARFRNTVFYWEP